MTIQKKKNLWRGSEAGDLDEYLDAFSASAGYEVNVAVHSRCQQCGGVTFSLLADDEEGVAERRCTACSDRFFMLDSSKFAEEAEMQECTCPCGGTEFNLAVGFSLREDGEDVRWVYVALRCIADGTLGVYTDWKIDYSPSAHLRSLA